MAELGSELSQVGSSLPAMLPVFEPPDIVRLDGGPEPDGGNFCIGGSGDKNTCIGGHDC